MIDSSEITILVVDDNEAGRYAISRTLLNAGFSVIKASTGKEALDIVANDNPTIIILDISLPDISGVEVCRRIKKDPLTSIIPIIHISACNFSTEDKVSGLESGSVAYLISPLIPAELIATVKAMVRIRHTEEQLRRLQKDLEQKIAARTTELEIANQNLMLEIKERKRIEEALRITEAKSQRLIQSNIIGVFFWNIAGHIVDANDAFLQIIGYTREDLESGKVDWSQMTPNEDRYLDEKATEELSLKKFCTPYEKRYIRKDGERISILVGGALFEDSTDQGVAFVLDLTERKRAELERNRAVDELRKSEERYRSLVSASSLIIWRTDANGIPIDDSVGWRQVTGQSKEEMQEWGWLNAVHPNEREQVRKSWLQCLETRTIFKTEYHISLPNGTDRLFTAQGVPIFEEDGSVREWIGTCTDITEQKQLEAQLLRAQRMESIGTLAGGIAHDLNNVLAPIIMSLQLFRKENTNTYQRRLLDTLEESAKRGADIIKQVLSFARGFEGNHVVLQPKYLINDVIKLIMVTFPRSITIETSIAADLMPIKGDATQLYQVLMNLCINARDAMPSGGRLEIEVDNIFLDSQYVAMNIDAKAGQYVGITIKDNGIGIPPYYLSQIFEPFFTTKEKGHGTGLGLSTSLGIIKSHNGFIEVASEPGQYTIFKIYLPIAESALIQSIEREDISLPIGNGEIILVIDDDKAIRDVTSATLETNGYNVLTAEDGSEAIAIFVKNKDKIKIVITDLMMPVMDGVMTIRALKKISAGLKVIAVSGVVMLNRDKAIAQLDVNAFLLKPFTAEQLVTTIAQLLDSHQTIADFK